jgi:hypothetical protein
LQLVAPGSSVAKKSLAPFPPETATKVISSYGESLWSGELLAGLHRVHCVAVSPKVADCTSASDAVKPPANNWREIFSVHSSIAEIFREMSHAVCSRARNFFFVSSLRRGKRV